MAVTALTAQVQKGHTNDTLTVTTTPQMHCSGCENRIKQNIRFVKGVKAITTSVADQKVAPPATARRRGRTPIAKAPSLPAIPAGGEGAYRSGSA